MQPSSRRAAGRPARPFARAVRRGLLAVFVVGAPGLASADDATELDPVVVTASRLAQPLSRALPATTVITRADIEDSHAPDLPTLLRGQAGVDIAQSGGLGSQASVFIRGANSNQVLVLVDGLRINATGSGAASIAHLMIDQIDHVEIVRGNVSSLYGSEAIGGVVQIFTRAGGDADRVAGSATAGGERNRAASVEAARTFGPADARTRVGVAASYRSADGFSAIDAGRVATANPDDDGYRNRSVSADVVQHFGAQEIGARYLESRGRLDYDDASDYGALDPGYDGRVQTQRERSRATDASLYGRLNPTSWWSVDLLAGQARDLSVNTASFPFAYTIGTTVSTDRQYRLVNALRFDGHAVTFGYEHLDQSGFATAYGDGVDGATFTRSVDSALVGYAGPLFLPSGANEFQFNARHDRYSDFGGATTGLAAYGLAFAPGWKAIVQASSAFKAPAFNELYYPYYGNTALRPERARSVEAALQYAAGGTLARLSTFRTRTRDLIVYDPRIFMAGNVDRARVSGAELTVRTVVDGWTLTGSATFERPIDEATDQFLLRRAGHDVGAALARTVGRFRFTADVRAAGRRFDTDIVTFGRTVLGGYTVADAGVRYEVVKGLTAGFALTNAFDRRYALVDGYNTAGRVALFTVDARY